MITTIVIFHVVSSAEYLQTWTKKPQTIRMVKERQYDLEFELNLSLQLVSAMLLIEI